MQFLFIPLTLITIFFSSTSTHAADQLMLSVGQFDFAQKDDEATMLGAEYRFDDFYHGLRPVAGAFITTDSSAYGYGGLQWDIFLTDHLVIAPQLAVGAYHEGAGKDLGNSLEFRSQLEVGYEFEDKTRISAMIGHLSNASMGDDNPGAETLTIGYAFPVTF